ncbi:MAG: energy-coupling factor transporter ATPase [Clostridia bacterium]|nr:energy-coupling factor transporter ATPase [Clostridia bacterium]
MEAIKFENVYFSYEPTSSEPFYDGQDGRQAFALNGIDFSVREGEFVAVLGHNGSGKSTLARLVNGLLSPTRGEIRVFGMPTSEENLFEIRKTVGIVFQNPDNQMVASIVEDDVAFGPENVGVEREEIGRRIDFALSSVGMEKFRTSMPTRLSGGQKQRIAIAGVLALKPRVMILDESTAMLDPRGRKEVMDVVLRLNKEEKITVLLITHFPEEAMLADRAIVMDHGKIVKQGAPKNVLLSGDVENYGLKMPISVRTCRVLRKDGVPVPDCLNATELALSLKKLLKSGGRYAMNEFNFWPYPSQTVYNKEDVAGGEIICKGLSYAYNESSPFETHALKGVDLRVPSGSFFGIIGHTGSGKSTFVQHLNGLIKLPTAQKKYKQKKGVKQSVDQTLLRVDGFDLTDKSTDFKALRAKVGMVFQYPEQQLFAETVFEDVAFGLRNFKPETSESEIEMCVREAIEKVGLEYEKVKNVSPFELSGGQKRRVAIAGVIVTKPEILVLDEPAAGLDPRGKEEIMSLLHDLKNSWCKTVIIVSHDMDEIAENCDRAAVFSDGKVLIEAETQELFGSAKALKDAGLGLSFTAQVLYELSNLGLYLKAPLKVCEFAKAVACAYNMQTEGGAGKWLT